MHDAHLLLSLMPSNPELIDIVNTLLAGFGDGSEQLVDMLQAVQHKLGYIPPSTVAAIADKTGLARPTIYKAIELSPSLTLAPTGKHTLYICNADNCSFYGGTALMERAKQQLGIHEFESTPDNTIRLEPFRCFGNCSMSPNVMVDGRVHGLMDNGQLDNLIASLRSDD